MGLLFALAATAMGAGLMLLSFLSTDTQSLDPLGLLLMNIAGIQAGGLLFVVGLCVGYVRMKQADAPPPAEGSPPPEGHTREGTNKDGTSRHGTVTLPDGRALAWSQRGTRAPTLLLIHGWCCDQRFWDAQLETLSRDFTVVTVDLAGHGLSSRLPAGSAYPIDAMARDVVTAIEQLELRELILVGHSLGGPVALEIAIATPDRCRKVIGVDTFTDAAMYRRRPPAEIAERCNAFRADFPRAMTALVRMITLHDALGYGVADWIATTMSAREPETAVAVLDALLRWDIEARWPLLTRPVATINSAPLVPLIQPIEGLAGLELEMMEHVGHFPMMEDPRGFETRLRRLIGRDSARPT
ncbi:putative hydrolase [Cystobacter fuscus DSM 2262]|uniref:Hydrolase n=2 Tax=Cystobacter fuscus TaxID=43 RepID=S9QVT5_CYSF2|nr:putative hydrolase [Cystobacter fuscus DSM 2262]